MENTSLIDPATVRLVSAGYTATVFPIATIVSSAVTAAANLGTKISSSVRVAARKVDVALDVDGRTRINPTSTEMLNVVVCAAPEDR